MIPIVLSRVYVGNQCSIKAALIDTDVPVLGFERKFKSRCTGIRDRTVYDSPGSRLRDSLRDHEHAPNERPQLEEEANPRNLAVNTASSDIGLNKERKHTNAASHQMPSVLQQLQASSSNHDETLDVDKSDDIELRNLMNDGQVSNTSTLQATKQDPQSLSEDGTLCDSMPQAFLGFSAAGDEPEPGSINTTRASGPILTQSSRWLKHFLRMLGDKSVEKPSMAMSGRKIQIDGMRISKGT